MFACTPDGSSSILLLKYCMEIHLQPGYHFN